MDVPDVKEAGNQVHSRVSGTHRESNEALVPKRISIIMSLVIWLWL